MEKADLFAQVTNSAPLFHKKELELNDPLQLPTKSVFNINFILFDP